MMDATLASLLNHIFEKEIEVAQKDERIEALEQEVARLNTKEEAN